MNRLSKLESYAYLGYFALILALVSLSLVFTGVVDVTPAWAKASLNESIHEVCWLELYNTDNSVYGFKVPVYDFEYYYSVFGANETTTRKDCQLMKSTCNKAIHQNNLGCRWFEEESLCECDFARIKNESNVLRYS